MYNKSCRFIKNNQNFSSFENMKYRTDQAMWDILELNLKK